MAAAAGYEEHALPILVENVKSWADGKLTVIPYQPYTTGVWYDKAMFENAGITETPTTWDEFLNVCEQLKASGVNAITCNSDGVSLLYGYQLARYTGQDKVLETLDNATWSEVPEAKQAADDIRSLFEKGYMSEYAPAQYPDGQNEIGFGESCMILNASWIPNEIVQNTGTEVDWGFFPWPSVEGGVDGAEAAVEALAGFIQECGLPTRLSQLRSKVEITPEVLRKVADTCNLIPSGPRQLSRDEIYDLLVECL